MLNCKLVTVRSKIYLKGCYTSLFYLNNMFIKAFIPLFNS